MIKRGVTILTKSVALIACAGILLHGMHIVLAQTAELDQIEKEIKQRESQISDINKRMDEYKGKINQYSSEAASLSNDLAMIENQAALIELDMEVTALEIENKKAEIERLKEEIAVQEERLNDQKFMLKEMIFSIHKKDSIDIIKVLFGGEDFHEIFSQVNQLQSVNEDLKNTLEITKHTKDTLERAEEKQKNQLSDLLDLQNNLEDQIIKLEAQQIAKEQLVLQTQQSEAEYRILMSQLRQEQQNVTNQVSALQRQMEQKLAEARGDDPATPAAPTTFIWPVNRGRITAIFHDPTYPFRHLFEHSGIDIAVVTGTPVKAAAPGIVAWARYGNSYGNYVMIIHDNGLATLYAHMSRLDVKANQVVTQGQVIGLSGNTGLSTGPHLHFEARLNGVPTNPANYVQGKLPR